jgi:hypothetical protein
VNPLNEHSPIPVELTIAEWNAVLGVLMDGQHRIVAPLITKIGNAVKQYADAYNAQLQPQLPVPRVANGADEASAG